MQRSKAYYRLVIFIVMACGVLAGCHSSKYTVSAADQISVNPQPGLSDGETLGKAAKKVIDVAVKWIGTPYLYGGDTRKGVDCSGLVCVAFDEGASMKLPRSSSEQAQYSRQIERTKLQPGDLVFFVSKTGGTRINHVAIYMGNNRIIHATTSKGVIISELSENYWAKHFHSCGRVLF